jgi:hypothetical protein
MSMRRFLISKEVSPGMIVKIQGLILLGVALFAIIWAVVRACVQSITIDEAFTYLYFAAKPLNTVWEPGSNNHVLNSLLMWMATHAFGTSNITVRAPALLGAVLYIFTRKFLSQSITARFSIQLPVFICLIYNPFILDFMVAARGYSLANAFLLTAVAVPVWYHLNASLSLDKCCALASLALGLSFASNFSFGFVDSVAFLALIAWSMRTSGRTSILRTLECCPLPGFFAVLLFCGYPLTHWPKGELWWGAHSLQEMAQSLTESTLYHMNPRFGGALYKIMRVLHPLLLPILGTLCGFQLLLIWLNSSPQRSTNGDVRTRWVRKFGLVLTAVLALTVVIHWLAFSVAQLPLPLGRTGIFFVPLSTLILGSVVATPAPSALSQWLRRILTGVFFCLAFYFILCLRLSYFREYERNADVKDVYAELARLNHAYGVTDVDVTALYVTALNYYRVLSQRETFPKFELEVPELSAGRSLYVMSTLEGGHFIDQQHLVIIYRGRSSDVVIAVDPNGPIPSSAVQLPIIRRYPAVARLDLFSPPTTPNFSTTRHFRPRPPPSPHAMVNRKEAPPVSGHAGAGVRNGSVQHRPIDNALRDGGRKIGALPAQADAEVLFTV